MFDGVCSCGRVTQNSSHKEGAQSAKTTRQAGWIL
jgi:hypothetical protein